MTISGSDEIDGDQHDQTSAPKTFPDALEGIYSILMFFYDTADKLKTVQDSLCVWFP